MNIRDEIRKSFEGLSQSEIIKKLQEAGFNLKVGTGKIIIRDK